MFSLKTLYFEKVAKVLLIFLSDMFILHFKNVFKGFMYNNEHNLFSRNEYYYLNTIQASTS